LLALDTEAEVVQAFKDVAGDLGVPLTVVEDPGDGEAARYAARLVLVRPDQFVAWMSTSPKPAVDDVQRLLLAVVGR
jgi:hypothetical protein